MIEGIYTFGFSGQWKFAAPALYFLLCWDCFSMEGYASRAFCWTPLRRLGNIGYSYFIHGLVLNSILLALPTFFSRTGNDLWLSSLGLPTFLCDGKGFHAVVLVG